MEHIMPTYLYRCTNCQKEQEFQQKISENPLTDCPLCNSATLKKIPARQIAIQFSGSGFYKTDYASGSSSGAPSKLTEAAPTNEHATPEPSPEKKGCGTSCGCH